MKSIAFFASLTILLFGVEASTCGYGKSASSRKHSKVATAEILKALKDKRAPASTTSSLPSYPEMSEQMSWGGDTPSSWRQEAMMANAASMAINEAEALASFADVIVSVPTEMRTSKKIPYGDGQSNASPLFGYPQWKDPTLPLFAALVRADGEIFIRVYVSKAPSNDMGGVDLYYENYGSFQKISATRNSSNSRYLLTDFALSLELASKLSLSSYFSKQVFLARPRSKNGTSWDAVFPIGFFHPVKKESELLAELPKSSQKVLEGSAVDPAKIGARYGSSESPFEKLMKERFGSEWTLDSGGKPFMPPFIHANFPENGNLVFTSSGMGWTWVLEKKPAAPFKILYTCFEARNTAKEINPSLSATDPNEKVAVAGSVPSGGGWHLIGDHAETIFNSLESAPVTVGWAIKNPFPKALLTGPLKGTNYAYGLTDFATIRRLRPGEALVTTRGGAWSDWEYTKDPRGLGELVDQSHFHWFFFEHQRPVCTVEWVHPCLPKGDKPGYSCY